MNQDSVRRHRAEEVGRIQERIQTWLRRPACLPGSDERELRGRERKKQTE